MSYFYRLTFLILTLISYPFCTWLRVLLFLPVYFFFCLCSLFLSDYLIAGTAHCKRPYCRLLQLGIPRQNVYHILHPTFKMVINRYLCFSSVGEKKRKSHYKEQDRSLRVSIGNVSTSLIKMVTVYRWLE